MSSQALVVQSYLPLPNQPGAVNNYAVSNSPAINFWGTDAKVDWDPTSKASLFFKYDNMYATSSGLGIFGIAGGPTPSSLTGPGNDVQSINVASIGGTYILSPTVLLTGNAGYQRMNQDVLNTSYGTDYSSKLGIPGIDGLDIRDSGFPNINFPSAYTSMGTPN